MDTNSHIPFGLLTVLLVFTMPMSGTAQSYMTKSGHVEFDSSVPLHSFTGVSDHLVGKITLNDSIVDFYVDVNTIETGISKRDRDMLRTLEAEKHPFAEFYGKIITDVDLNNDEPKEVTVQGEFSVHGVSKQTTITGTIQKVPTGIHVEASWTLNMKDYNIEPPGILFYRVSEKISVSISATLNPT